MPNFRILFPILTMYFKFIPAPYLFVHICILHRILHSYKGAMQNDSSRPEVTKVKKKSFFRLPLMKKLQLKTLKY